jgi:adenylate cyclase
VGSRIVVSVAETGLSVVHWGDFGFEVCKALGEDEGLVALRKSDELVAVLKRLMVAIHESDAVTARGLISRQAETLLIGSDDREWFYGVEAHEVIGAQLASAPGYERTFQRLEAYEEGRIGWGAAKSTDTYPNGHTVTKRTTAVFALEEGVWRATQVHASQSVPDDRDWFGVDIPYSLSELVDSLGDHLNRNLAARLDTSTVALLISDIEESTDHGVEYGDALWNDVVQRHFGDLERITAANGGTVVKTMGDGALIAFDTPHGAAQAAIEMQATVAQKQTVGNYRIRIGVHMGDAIHTDNDYFGYTVNKTARLASNAQGGQTLISEPARQAIDQDPDFVVGESISLDLKGLPGTHIAYPLKHA